MRLVQSILTAASLVVSATPALAAEIATGAKLPAGFVAVDLNGKPRNLASITGRKGVVLVLFRSARWCPFCQGQLKEMKALQAPLAQRGYTLAALSYDPPAVLAKFAGAQGLGYTFLSDEKSRVIDLLGLRDPEYGAGSFAEGVPKASTLVIDAKGKLLWKAVATDYKVRPQNAAILKAVDSIK